MQKREPKHYSAQYVLVGAGTASHSAMEAIFEKDPKAKVGNSVGIVKDYQESHNEDVKPFLPNVCIDFNYWRRKRCAIYAPSAFKGTVVRGEFQTRSIIVQGLEW